MEAAAASSPTAALQRTPSAGSRDSRAASSRISQPVRDHEVVLSTGGGDRPHLGSVLSGLSSSSGTTFSIGGAAENIAQSHPTCSTGRGGKAAAAAGSRKALSRDANASCGDGVEALVARLDLQSSKSKQKVGTQEREEMTSTHLESKQQQQQREQHQLQHQEIKQQYRVKQQESCAKPDLCANTGSSPSESAVMSSKQDRPQEQSKKQKEESASAAGKKQAGTEAASQVPASAAPAPVKNEPDSLRPKSQQQHRQQESAVKKKQDEKPRAKFVSASTASHAAQDTAAASFHVCGLCASGYSVAAVHPCGHRDVCAKCDLKMRTVVKDKRCCFCKNTTETVIYADVHRQENYKELVSMCHEHNVEWAAVFDSVETRDLVDDLVALGCPVCKTRFADETSLKTHVKSVHRLQYCSVCLEQRTALLCEQTLYTEADHKSHMLAHPKCRFCRVSFLDDDKLFAHMERSHLRCHLCHQAGQVYQYFTNLDSFRIHCGERHFVCSHPECNIDQCRVFASAVELADHELDHKDGSVSRSERARVLQVAFWGATGSQPSFNQEDVMRQRGGRGRGAQESVSAVRPAAPVAAPSAPSESGEEWPGLGSGGSANSNSMASTYPSPVTRQELDSHFPALPGSEDVIAPERNRRLGSDRGNAAQSDAPWLRDLTRPLSPFTEPGEMMNRNKDLAAR
jgi:hypothetical protein